MNEVASESRHPIQIVARRTGLTPDVIRVWERRYSAVSPSRSETRRRLYSDEDVERLILLRKATLAGRRIGDVAHLTDEDLGELVESDARSNADVPRPARGETSSDTPESASTHLGACIRAVEDLDAQALEAALTRARLELSTPVLIDTVLMPLLHEVGERWRSGSIRPYQEHLATTMVKSLLENLRPFSAQPVGGPEFVVTTLAGQHHELGAMMAAVVGATEGWRVTYLGPSLPAEEIAAAAIRRRARAVGLSIVYPPDDPNIPGELARLRRLLPREVGIVVGGRSASNYASELESVGASLVTDFDSLRSVLDRLRTS
jgi:DNA-binding transcriptional MerR regulator/methylmalonyl-CoA mutase cobalamin-binding subunit